MVKLYLLDASSIEREGLYNDVLEVLESDRRDKVKRLKNPYKAAVSAGAGLLLQYALDKACVGDKSIVRNEHGKPFLKSGEVYFNLSHSGDMAVCALSDTEVGVDTERMKKADLRLAERFFSPEEYTFIMESADRDRAFFRLWTLKESFVKAAGVGISRFGDFCIHIDGNEIYLDNNINHNSYEFFEYEENGYLIALCLRTV